MTEVSAREARTKRFDASTLSDVGKQIIAIATKLKKIEKNGRGDLAARFLTLNERKKELIKQTVYPTLRSRLCTARDTVNLLQWYLRLNLESRFKTLATDLKLDSGGSSSRRNESCKKEARERIFQRTISTCDALLCEIMRDLEEKEKEEEEEEEEDNQTRRKNTSISISRFLKKTRDLDFPIDLNIGIERIHLTNLRAGAVHTGVRISEILSRCIAGLLLNEREVMTAELINFLECLPQHSIVAKKISQVLDVICIEYGIEKSEETNPGADTGGGEEEAIAIKSLKNSKEWLEGFEECILLLHFVLSADNLPNTLDEDAVDRGRIRIKYVMGVALHLVQVLEISVINFRSACDEVKKLKSSIGDIWKLERYL